MKKCGQCGKDFLVSSRHKKCSSCRHENYKKRYNKRCGCGKQIQQQSQMCRTCANREKQGEYLGKSRYLTKKGYVYIRIPEHPRANKVTGFVFDHILVMEQKLGRYLLAGENVHHVNGIRDDNRPENLELWIRPQPSGIRAKDAVIWARRILALYNNEKVMGL